MGYDVLIQMVCKRNRNGIAYASKSSQNQAKRKMTEKMKEEKTKKWGLYPTNFVFL